MSGRQKLVLLLLWWGGLLVAFYGLQAVIVADVLRFGLGAARVLVAALALAWFGPRWRHGGRHW
jgi:hypothetical protein